MLAEGCSAQSPWTAFKGALDVTSNRLAHCVGTMAVVALFFAAASADGRGASQPEPGPAAKALSAGTAPGRWHAESGTDRTQQGLLASGAVPGLQAGPAPSARRSRISRGPRALAMQRRAELSKCDPQGYCMPPSGPRLMTTPFPMEIIQLPAAEAHRDDLRGRHAHLARHLHGRPAASRGRRAEPDVAWPFGRPLGRRHAGRGRRRLQRRKLDRHGRRSAHRSNCISSSGSRARISTRCATKPPSTIRARTPNPGPLASISSGTRRARFRSTSVRRTVPGCGGCSRTF